LEIGRQVNRTVLGFGDEFPIFKANTYFPYKNKKRYKRPGYSYDVFKTCVTDPTVLDECEIPDEWKNILLSNIKRRLTPQAVKCRADIEVSCYAYDGIDAIKNSLKEGLKMSTEDKPIKINLIAPPVYVVTSSSLDRDEGVKLLKEVIEKIKVSIETMKGRFKVKMEPKVVTDLDEAELARQMDMLEAENEQIAGDTDSEEDSDSSEEDDEDEEGGGGGEKTKKKKAIEDDVISGLVNNLDLNAAVPENDDDASWS